MLTVQFSDLCWEKFFQRLWALKWPESGSRRDSLVNWEKRDCPKQQLLDHGMVMSVKETDLCRTIGKIREVCLLEKK